MMRIMRSWLPTLPFSPPTPQHAVSPRRDLSVHPSRFWHVGHASATTRGRLSEHSGRVNSLANPGDMLCDGSHSSFGRWGSESLSLYSLMRQPCWGSRLCANCWSIKDTKWVVWEENERVFCVCVLWQLMKSEKEMELTQCWKDGEKNTQIKFFFFFLNKSSSPKCQNILSYRLNKGKG